MNVNFFELYTETIEMFEYFYKHICHRYQHLLIILESYPTQACFKPESVYKEMHLRFKRYITDSIKKFLIK